MEEDRRGKTMRKNSKSKKVFGASVPEELEMRPVFAHRTKDRDAPSPTNDDLPDHRSLVARWIWRYGKNTVRLVSETEGLDREVWYERAARLFKAEDIFGRIEDVHTGDNPREGVFDVGNFDYGSYPSKDDIRLAREWYRSPVFREAANRDLVLCDAPTGEENDRNPGREDIYEAVVRLSQDRNRDLMIKVVSRNKYQPLVRVQIPQGSKKDEVASIIGSSLGWTLIHLEGEKDAFLLSDYVEMTYEYRIIVIGGRPIVGGGNVPSLDGVCSSGLWWDRRMTQFLGESKYNIVSLRKMVLEYKRFAKKVAKEALKEQPNLRNYCLDVCMVNESPTIVELNSIRNCGTFAINPRRLIMAIWHDSLKICVTCGDNVGRFGCSKTKCKGYIEVKRPDVASGGSERYYLGELSPLDVVNLVSTSGEKSARELITLYAKQVTAQSADVAWIKERPWDGPARPATPAETRWRVRRNIALSMDDGEAVKSVIEEISSGIRSNVCEECGFEFDTYSCERYFCNGTINVGMRKYLKKVNKPWRQTNLYRVRDNILDMIVRGGMKY